MVDSIIEVTCVPVLLKAVDLFFDEGKRILQERKERRKGEKDANLLNSEISNKSSFGNEKVNNIIASKNEAICESIPKSAWLNSEAKIKHLTSLLEIYIKNYYLTKEQYARWGNALVPPIVLNNLTESENAVAETIKALQFELEKVYGKDVILSEV